MKQDMIVILDLGSTENTVVAREIRDMGVYSEIHPHDITPEELNGLDNVKGIILNGGENRVVDGVAVDVSPALYDLGYPVIAIDHPTAKCAQKLDALPDEATLKKFSFIYLILRNPCIFKENRHFNVRSLCIFPCFCPYEPKQGKLFV